MRRKIARNNQQKQAATIKKRAIATLLDGTAETGDHAITWQADGVPSGLYFYRIQTGREFESGEIVVLSE
jgi:hypothetical protein